MLGDSGSSEPEDSDIDSGIGCEGPESTQSVTSSVLKHQFLYGRRWHSSRWGRLIAPNDEFEQELMTIFHLVFLSICNQQLFLAPLDMPKAILDVGTGTGDWALDVSDQYPGAYVIAIDLSVIQPDFVAPNLEFQIADCEEEWTFQQTFDLIHLRNLNGAITNWPQLISRASNQLTKGGWLELIEVGDVFDTIQEHKLEESAISIWQRFFRQATYLGGRPIRSCSSLVGDFRDVGLQDVQSHCIQVPIGPWKSGDGDHEVGPVLTEYLCGALEGISLPLFLGVLKWPANEFYALLSEVRIELRSGSRHLACHIHHCQGRKN